MKTRYELWKKYRDDIEKNISLQKAVHQSNEKLNILFERLIKVYPEYETKYKDQESFLNFSLEKIDEIPKYSSENIENMLFSISEIENDYAKSFSSIDKLDFSSKELDDVIKNIKKGKIKSLSYISNDDSLDIEILDKKYIEIGGKMKRINIAIDGPSGTGKSTVARLIAKKFGYKYINTGLVYRAVALYVINNNIDISNENIIIDSLKKITIKFDAFENVFLNEEEVTKELRNDEVSQKASLVATIPKVRKWAVNIQQKMVQSKGVVMDGRDTTFVVLPNAELKIFLDTNLDVRTNRRVEQNKKLGFATNYDKIFNEIKIRDERDKTRSADPLYKANDAVLIDSSNLTLEQVVNKIEQLVKKII